MDVFCARSASLGHSGLRTRFALRYAGPNCKPLEDLFENLTSNTLMTEFRPALEFRCRCTVAKCRSSLQ